MTLTRVERRWAVAAMEAIFPGSREAGLAGIRGMNVDGFLRELMANLPRRAALGVRLAVWLAALAPFFVLGRTCTIARLDVADRQRVLGALLESETYAIRSLVLVLKTMGALLYAADRDVRTRMVAPRTAPAPRVVALRVKRAPAV